MADTPIERRRLPRRRALKACKAVYGDFRYTIDCVVRDLTPDGARLRADAAMEIPDDFYLFDGGEGRLQRAEVIWRTGNELGVRFVGTPIAIHESTDPRHARFRYM